MTLRLTLLLSSGLILAGCSDDPQPPTPTPPKAIDASIMSIGQPGTRVIYGKDNRLDFYQTSDAWQKIAMSTAALVRNSRITPRPRSEFELHISSYATDYNLCSDEPFFNQGTLAFCSGFYVGGDYMVTAGHCIRTQSDCDATSFVFNFAVHEDGATPTRAQGNDVYRCRKIVQTQMATNGADFAVIELDRAVTGRTPARIRRAGSIAPGKELVVIGHPAGLPTKVADQGIVRVVNDGFLVASLDTYGGNSGSAVFNADTGEVEGVLVRGEMDFKYRGECRVSNVCEQGSCRGEDVTLISHALPFLPSR